MEILVKMIKDGPIYSHEQNFFKSNGLVLLPKALIGSVGNCFLQVLCNERFSREDQSELFQAGIGSFNFQTQTDEYGLFLSILPWIRFLMPSTSNYKILRESSLSMYNFMKKLVDKKIASYEKDETNNFIDLYMNEMKQNNDNRDFNYEQLVMICTDFLFPSLSAVETQISFLIRELLHREDVLLKIQAEIDQVVGEGRLPSLDDRVK
jgi:hypothetical protein